MRRKNYTYDEKNRVKELLSSQRSYAEITRILGVPKSTISTWFGKPINEPWRRKTQLEHLKEIRKSAMIAIKKKWDKKREEDSLEIKNNLDRELIDYPFQNQGFYKSMLAMLYWAEGEKKGSGPKFANTDPKLARLYISLLRKCYNIDESKFRIRLHLHYYHSIKKSKSFWARTLSVPLDQFTKIGIKKRSVKKRFRKNFAGICFIYYGNSKIRKELLELGSRLESLINNNAPIT